MISYVNHFHLGDCFWHCLWLRKAAKFIPQSEVLFYCNLDYHMQLAPVLYGTKVALVRTENHPPDAINCWIGDGPQGIGWSSTDLRFDVIAFLIRWFEFQSKQAGIPVVFKDRTDFLCDYPSLLYPLWTGGTIDWLVLNSTPMSSQFQWDESAMNRVIMRMSAAGHTVVCTSMTDAHVPCTRKLGYSITDIGSLSLMAKSIIAVANGPVWPTFNIWNQRKFTERIMLINDIHVDYGEKLPHFGTIPACEQYLESKGYL